MYHVNVFFINENKSTNFNHECVIPALPKVGDLIGVEDPINKPFKTVVAKIENVVLVLNPTKLGVYQNQVLIAAKILIVSENAITLDVIAL